MSYKVEVVLKNVVELGEGPHWDDATQTLLFIDIPNGDIYRYDPATDRKDVLHLDGNIGFVVPREKGGLVVGLKNTFSAVDWASKTVVKLAEVEVGDNTRMNDGKCDPQGRLWGGTMSYTFEPGKANLYRLDIDGSLKKMVEHVTISNGLAWTDDNKTMYYIDTTPHKVYAYDYDNATGDISNKRVAVDLDTVPEFKGNVPGPDGMTIDTDGNIWVALFGGAGVAKFDPNTGKLLQKVDIPQATKITSVCWGGKNHDELYVTSFRQPTEPNGGSLFRVTGLGVKGIPATIYRG